MTRAILHIYQAPPLNANLVATTCEQHFHSQNSIPLMSTDSFAHKYPTREIVSVLKKQRLIISENRLNQRYQFYEEKGG